MLASTALRAENIMTATPQETPAETQAEVIDTRFGKATLNRDAGVSFPRGLPGLADFHEYCICEFPVQKFSAFKLLQSLENIGLSLIILPLEIANGIIEAADVISACDELETPVKDAALYLVVTVHRDEKGVRFSVNARAPIVVNKATMSGAQHIFTGDKYEVQHML